MVLEPWRARRRTSRMASEADAEASGLPADRRARARTICGGGASY